MSFIQERAQLVLRFRSSHHIAPRRSLVLEIRCIDRRSTPLIGRHGGYPSWRSWKVPAQQSPAPFSTSLLSWLTLMT